MTSAEFYTSEIIAQFARTFAPRIIPVIFDGMLDRNVPLPCYRFADAASPLSRRGNGASLHELPRLAPTSHAETSR